MNTSVVHPCKHTTKRGTEVASGQRTAGLSTASEEGNRYLVMTLKSKEAELRGVVTTGSHKLSPAHLVERTKQSPQDGY